MRRKRLWVGLAFATAFVALLVVSNFVWDLWQINGESGTFSMAWALLPMFHARGAIGEDITPDAHSRDLQINKRVIGVPGDTVVGRSDRVYVDGKKADDIPTRPFPAVHLGSKEYFVMGDNRSVSYDSRGFGPVPRGAIYARVVLIVWPFGRVGVPRYDKTQKPPGTLCGG